MTLHLFTSGELIRDPEARTSQGGKPYVTALVRAGEALVSLSAFDEDLRAELARLKRGDPVAASGRLSVNAYLDRTTGEPRPGLSLMVTALMAAPARKAKAKPRPKAPAAAGEPFDDDLSGIGDRSF